MVADLAASAQRFSPTDCPRLIVKIGSALLVDGDGQVRRSAVGAFANRNHFAAFFFCALPLVAAVFASRKQVAGAPLWMLGALLAFVMILGLSISGSRSALILGAAAVAASALFVAPHGNQGHDEGPTVPPRRRPCRRPGHSAVTGRWASRNS